MTGREAFEHFQRNTRVLKANLGGVDEEMSLVRAPNGGNSFRWILGHLLRSRQEVLEFLGGAPAIELERLEVFRRGGKGAYRDEELLRLADLLALWEESEQRLGISLENAVMDAPNEEWGSMEKALVGYCFHEAYHTGQTGILRRVAGLEGAIG